MSSFWEAYKSFVRQNHQWLSSAESAAQGLTWVLPERFASSELTVEGISSVLGIFQLLNEHIVQSYPVSQIPNAQQVPLPPPSHHGPIRGLHRPHPSFQGGRGPPPPGLHGPPPVTDAVPRHVSAHKSLPWPVLVAVVGQLEVLAETAATEYRGEDKKWGVVALVEGLKVVLRLLILRHAAGRMLIDGGEEPNETPEAVANTAVAVAEATGNDRPVLDASDAIIKAGPAGPSPYSDEFAPPARPKDKGGMALHAFAKFQQRNFTARAQRTEGGASARGKQKESDIEAGYNQPPWWANDPATDSSPEALSSIPVHSRDPTATASSQQPSSKQGLSKRGPFQTDEPFHTDGPSTSGRGTGFSHQKAGHLDQKKLNLEIGSRGRLQRYDTPRPEELEAPLPSRLLASVLSERIDVETLDLPSASSENIDVESGNRTLKKSKTLNPVPATERVARACLGAGEVLHVIRPLVYVLAMRRWGARKWKPWLLSLGVDAASMALVSAGDELLKRGSRGKGEEAEAGLSEQERSEMGRRRVLLLMYLMRSPVFEIVTKPPADAVGRFLQPVPLLGSLAGKALEILEGVQGYYFYTAAS